jgi:hypothetical protein
VGNPRRLVPLPAKRHWGKKRRVRFDEQPVLGNESQERIVSPLLERYDSAKGDVPPRFERELRQRMAPRVAMEHSPNPSDTCFADDCARIILGVPRVYDHRPLRLGRERYLR